MSVVMTCVLVVNYEADDDLAAGLAQPVAGSRQSFGQISEAAIERLPAHGRKMPEVEIYVAGFDGIQLDALLDWLRELPWGDNDATLVVSDEADEYVMRTFRIPEPPEA